jgi:hypothetical protein
MEGLLPTIRFGFTQIELVVMITIVVISAALVLPAPSNAKIRPQRILCMSHTRQITVDWILYVGGQATPEQIGPSRRWIFQSR